MEYLKQGSILLAIAIAFYFGYTTGHEVGYQKASARIYSSLHYSVYQDWVRVLMESEFSHFMDTREALK